MKYAVYLLAATLSLCLQSQAKTSDVITIGSYSCKSKSKNVEIRGEINKGSVVATISDRKSELEVRDLKPLEQNVVFDQINRKKEDAFKFAKFYNDFNAWQGIEMSFPKDIIKGERTGRFSGFFTVYNEGSRFMVPGETVQLDCRALGMSIGEVNPLAQQAEKIKSVIGDALHISEGDSEWSAYYQRANVKDFSPKQIAAAMAIKNHFEIYPEKVSVDFLLDYANDNDNKADAAKYEALLFLMQHDFKMFRLIKVGQPDSGALDLYLIGITAEGNLVGLKTISVET